MYGMFMDAISFKGKLSKWNVSRVLVMHETVRNATLFFCVLVYDLLQSIAARVSIFAQTANTCAMLHPPVDVDLTCNMTAQRMSAHARTVCR